MITDYSRAKKLGEREYRRRLVRGQYPYLPSLEEMVRDVDRMPEIGLGLAEIPLDMVVGTRTTGRQNAFAANFMPLVGEDSEFAAKWSNLYDSQVEEGIRDPVKVYEFMNRFYVQEGNKRVSVLNYVGAVSVLANIIRIRPPRTDSEQSMTYYEYLRDHQRGPLWDEALSAIFGLFASDDKDDRKKDSLNLFRLTPEQKSVMGQIQQNVVCIVDKKSDIISVNVTDQDPVVAAMVADSVRSMLQQSITDYRTSKVRHDLAYIQQLHKEAKQKYERACDLYADFVDTNRDVMLERIVLEAISDLADFARCYEPVFLYMLQQQSVISRGHDIQAAKQKLEQSQRRIREIDRMMTRMYEDNVCGRLPDDRYARMAGQYEAEQKELIASVSECEQTLSLMQKNTVDLRMLLKGLREFTELRSLTPELVNTLIRRIEIHNAEKIDGKRHVQVDIYFTAVGMINLPTKKELQKMMAEIQSRQSSFTPA